MMWIASASSSSRCVSVRGAQRAHATPRFAARAPAPRGARAPRAADSAGSRPSVSRRSSGILRLLVRIGDAGEMLDLARERLLVEALRVALGAHLERRRDVDLDERRVLLDERARAAARLLVRRDRARRRRPRRRGRAARRPSRCARCSCRGPPSRSRAPSRGACARRRRRGTSTVRPRASSSRRDERADRRLAGGREAGEPQRRSRSRHDASTSADGDRVDAALDLVGAGPAARAARARLRRVRVADRVVAPVVQRVVRQPALADVLPALRVPVGERVRTFQSFAFTARAARPSRASARPRASATGRGGCR